LGSGGHSRCGRRWYTDANAHSYSDTHADSDSHGNSIDNAYAATNANAQGGAIGKAASNAAAQAVDLPN
jgi:hypothetical protein